MTDGAGSPDDPDDESGPESDSETGGWVDEPLQPPSTDIRPFGWRGADSSQAPTAGTGDRTDGNANAPVDEDEYARADGRVEAAASGDAGVDPLVAVYRHDVHKMRMRSHDEAEAVFAGVRVNEPVPLGADGDAALLSRPDEEPEQTVANHASPFRLSLVTGEMATKVGRIDGEIGQAQGRLVRINDPVAMHEAWLESSVAAIFNETVYYPYTSLKFHTLLAAALLDNYRAGFEFADLFLAVDPPAGDSPGADEAASGDGPSVVPHRTVLSTPVFALRVTGEPGDRPAARLGDAPAQSFADVWTRLPAYPFDSGEARVWRVLDAQLRRIRSWSTALQFTEEFLAWWDTVQSRRGGAP